VDRSVRAGTDGAIWRRPAGAIGAAAGR